MKKLLLFIIAFVLFIATVIYLAFRYGGELFSEVVADIIPIEIQKQIGKATIESMDIQNLEKTSLSIYTQNKIKKRFYELIKKDSNEVQLLFRNAPFANAFALPGNYIIILDSLIRMSEDTIKYTDVLGVLLHEAGHLNYKHSLRLMIKSALTATIIGYFIGDFSAFLATVTHQLLSLSYSRSYEEQADDYAIQLLQNNNMTTLPLAHLLEKISQQSNEGEMPEFLSTHPVTEERVKKLREMNKSIAK